MSPPRHVHVTGQTVYVTGGGLRIQCPFAKAAGGLIIVVIFVSAGGSHSLLRYGQASLKSTVAAIGGKAGTRYVAAGGAASRSTVCPSACAA